MGHAGFDFVIIDLEHSPNSAEEANRIVQRAKFAPEGHRGVCRFVRAADYSAMDRYRYFEEANESIVILHLEGEEALGNLSKIIQVEGIDILFIGPYDLSQSTVGTFVDTLENAVNWREAGIKYLSYSVDVGIFYEACQYIVHSLRTD